MQLIYQNNIIKDYENWTHLLINIINHTKSNSKDQVHVDYATPIQKHLEKLNRLEMDSLEMQKKFIRQNEKIIEKQKELNKLSSKLEIIRSDTFNNNENKGNMEKKKEEKRESLIQETEQLVDNIDLMSEELDHLYLCLKKHKTDSDSEIILSLLKEIKELEQENKDLKKIKNFTYKDFFSQEDELLGKGSEKLSHLKTHKKHNSNSSNAQSASYNLFTKEDKLIEREIIIKKQTNDNINKRNKNNNMIYDLSSLSCFSNNNALNENDSTLNYLK